MPYYNRQPNILFPDVNNVVASVAFCLVKFSYFHIHLHFMPAASWHHLITPFLEKCAECPGKGRTPVRAPCFQPAHHLVKITKSAEIAFLPFSANYFFIASGVGAYIKILK